MLRQEERIPNLRFGGLLLGQFGPDFRRRVRAQHRGRVEGPGAHHRDHRVLLRLEDERAGSQISAGGCRRATLGAPQVDPRVRKRHLVDLLGGDERIRPKVAREFLREPVGGEHRAVQDHHGLPNLLPRVAHFIS